MNGFSTIERDITVCYNKGKIFALRSEITSKGGAIVEDRTFDLLTKMYSEFTNTFSKMDQRLGTLETSVSKMDQRLGTLETRFDKVDQRLGTLETGFDKVDQRLGTLETRFDKVDQRLGTLETGFDEMNEKMDSLNGHVIRLENKQNIDSKALFDGYKQIYENTVEMKSDFKAIKEILMEHEIRLRKVK